jgi:Fe-S cluster biogenesis protein NfuA
MCVASSAFGTHERNLAFAHAKGHLNTMFIQTEPTPNPAVLKFLPGRELLASGTREFRDEAEARASPLAESLFAVPGVTRVFFAGEYLTVTKAEDQDWSWLKAPILAAIMDHFTGGQALLRDDENEGHDAEVYEGDAAGIVAEIKDLLDSRIRPAVAQDGGDILFSKFEPATGVLWLHMRGACSGCPSSAATLRAGVENMMRHYVPEVTRVEQTL